jgi:hypothetical protein
VPRGCGHHDGILGPDMEWCLCGGGAWLCVRCGGWSSNALERDVVGHFD